MTFFNKDYAKEKFFSLPPKIPPKKSTFFSRSLLIFSSPLFQAAKKHHRICIPLFMSGPQKGTHFVLGRCSTWVGLGGGGENHCLLLDVICQTCPISTTTTTTPKKCIPRYIGQEEEEEDPTNNALLISFRLSCRRRNFC